MFTIRIVRFVNMLTASVTFQRWDYEKYFCFQIITSKHGKNSVLTLLINNKALQFDM
jgi:hypothetical protein